MWMRPELSWRTWKPQARVPSSRATDLQWRIRESLSTLDLARDRDRRHRADVRPGPGGGVRDAPLARAWTRAHRWRAHAASGPAADGGRILPAPDLRPQHRGGARAGA